MGNIFSFSKHDKDLLLPVKYVDVGMEDKQDLEKYYDKHHNNTIAEAYLWGVI